MHIAFILMIFNVFYLGVIGVVSHLGVEPRPLVFLVQDIKILTTFEGGTLKTRAYHLHFF
jgi:hypothetical protein